MTPAAGRRAHLHLIHPELLERAAKAAYQECIVTYTELTPLSAAFQAIAAELSAELDVWDKLGPELREHWRRIAARALFEALPRP